MELKILPTEYTVKRTGPFWEADVLLGGENVATVRKGKGISFVVRMKNGGKGYLLDPRVDGTIKPFSITAREAESGEGEVVLKIRDNLFSHNGQMYIMKNVPEGSAARDHLLGTKFVTRLVNFPFKSPDEVDLETIARLGRHRGVKVGEMSGLGMTGHRVKLEKELEDIGLPLAVASYLIYASG